MEKILLTELLVAGIDFKKDPTSANQDILDNLINKIQVKTYQKLKDKSLALALIVNQAIYTKDGDAVETEMSLEMAKAIYGILPYAINVDNDMGSNALQYGVYDNLYEFGIIDTILKYCGQDYQRLDKMVDETINFANIYRMSEVAALMSPENLQSFIQTVTDLQTELTPEKMDFLKQMSLEGSPEWQALKETLGEDIVDRVMQQDLQTALKTPDENENENENENELEEGQNV